MHQSRRHAQLSRRTFEKGTRSSGAHQSAPAARYGGWNASPLVSPSQITARILATIDDLKFAAPKPRTSGSSTRPSTPAVIQGRPFQGRPGQTRERPETAHLAQCVASRRRSPHPADSGHSGLGTGTALHAPKPTFKHDQKAVAAGRMIAIRLAADGLVYSLLFRKYKFAPRKGVRL
jgi:hypothetical protein